MKTLVINGTEVHEPVTGQTPEEQKAKSKQPANKARKAENK